MRSMGRSPTAACRAVLTFCSSLDTSCRKGFSAVQRLGEPWKIPPCRRAAAMRTSSVPLVSNLGVCTESAAAIAVGAQLARVVGCVSSPVSAMCCVHLLCDKARRDAQTEKHGIAAHAHVRNLMLHHSS